MMDVIWVGCTFSIPVRVREGDGWSVSDSIFFGDRRQEATATTSGCLRNDAQHTLDDE